MSGDLQSRVATWVETSGRALELRTARTLRQAGARFVNQSMPYDDPRTKEQREGDVRGAVQWEESDGAYSVEFAVECKSGREHPWVAFYDGRMPLHHKLGQWGVLSTGWTEEAKNRLAEELFFSEWLNDTGLATHAAAALGKDSRNTAQDAARQALSFAIARARSPLAVKQGNSVEDTRSMVFPIVVTQAPLFACSLSDDAEVVVEAVDHFDVLIHVDRFVRHRVYVMSEASFETKAKRLGQLRHSWSI